ncbi:NADPH-dependent FMN reductase [Corynebacterium choanae]|uniref:FMN-dependent NADH-azoreductase n=1 Tax=Corynebacterium choanae TaxID=1862358 RepID=A0A3G6J5S7_9CORY|nr:NAD(P)H-dependent oxidoreductase [Corynebacterium choanae]AZA13113.1 FMN-dependent NADH-azoreductase [Corynebacterium choanae]
MTTTPHIGIFVGSIRDKRTSPAIGQWVHQVASDLVDTDSLSATFAIVDLQDHPVPPLTDELPPKARDGQYPDPQVARWAETVKAFDGFVFISPEYNASIPGTMKNAFDSIYVEWQEKPVSFVGFGSTGASTALKHWHDVVNRVGMAHTGEDVLLTFADDFADHKPAPRDSQRQTLTAQLRALVAAAQAAK